MEKQPSVSPASAPPLEPLTGPQVRDAVKVPGNGEGDRDRVLPWEGGLRARPLGPGDSGHQLVIGVIAPGRRGEGRGHGHGRPKWLNSRRLGA